MHLNPPPGMSLHDYMHTSSSIIAPSATTCTSCGLVALGPETEERHRVVVPNNPPPYLTMCGHRNPMSLLRLRSQSHQSVFALILTIHENQQDTYDSRVCLYCPFGVTGSEIHLILE